MKDTGYTALPLGAEAADYLRFKSRRLTEASRRDYESCLDKLARHFPERELGDFEPPAGAILVEEFMTARWGERAPRTYNKNLSVIRDFFIWQVRRGRLRGDPTLSIERARPRNVYRTTFTAEQRTAILAANADLRDHLALRLLLDYGIRKGALQRVRFEHFDEGRRRLVIFTKGERVHQVPIPDPTFWAELEQLVDEPDARPTHFLLCRQKMVSRRARAATLTAALDAQLEEAIVRARRLSAEIVSSDTAGALARLEEAEALLARTRLTAEKVINRRPDQPMGQHGLHDWWYRCLARAGIVAAGTTSGERMHKARHSAGQRVLDTTNNLKAVQMLLGHASIRTTADSYLDWDLEQLAETMREVLGSP